MFPATKPVKLFASPPHAIFYLAANQILQDFVCTWRRWTPRALARTDDDSLVCGLAATHRTRWAVYLLLLRWTWSVPCDT